MSLQLALNLPNPLAAAQSLFLDHGHPVTTSRALAERFDKKHFHVIRGIEKIIVDLADPTFSASNFGFSEYKNKRGKTLPEYRITRDGFALLAMGFTGRDALAWKVAFIAAFNALEAELRAKEEERHALLPVSPPPSITSVLSFVPSSKRPKPATRARRSPNRSANRPPPSPTTAAAPAASACLPPETAMTDQELTAAHQRAFSVAAAMTSNLTPTALLIINAARAQGNQRLLSRMFSGRMSLPSIEELEAELGRDFVQQFGDIEMLHHAHDGPAGSALDEAQFISTSL